MSIGTAFEDTTDRIKRQGARRTPDSALVPVLRAMPFTDGRGKRKQILFDGATPENDAIAAIVDDAVAGNADERAQEQAKLFRKELWKASRQAGLSARSSVATLEDGDVLVQFWVAGPFEPRGPRSNGDEEDDE